MSLCRDSSANEVEELADLHDPAAAESKTDGYARYPEQICDLFFV